MKSDLVATIAIVFAIVTQSNCGLIFSDFPKEESDSSETNLPNTNPENASLNDQLGRYKSYAYTWKIFFIAEMLTQYGPYLQMPEIPSQDGASLESPLFWAYGYPYEAKAKLQIKNGNAYVSLAFIDDDHAGETVPFVVLPGVTYTLMDLNGTGKDIVRSFEYDFFSTLKYNLTYYEKLLCDQNVLLDSVYNRSDAIVIDVAIDPPSVVNATASADGTLAGTIDHYALRKQREVDGLEYFTASPYFYTSPTGYRVKVGLHLNGYGSYVGVGLTAEIMFLTGENDAYLGVSFPHTATFVIFNQVDPSNNYVKSVEFDLKINTDYFVDLLSHGDLESSDFLVDDTFYYKVVIEQSDS